MTIGGYNKNFMLEELTYHKVVKSQKMAWEVSLEGFSIDKNAIPLNTNEILLDTGTSMLILSK